MSYVYFIGAPFNGPPGDMVKIGFTRSHPRTRLHDLQCGSPMILTLLAYAEGGIEYERALHEFFAPRYSHREWFHLCPVSWDFINRIRGGETLADLIDPSEFPQGMRCTDIMNRKGITEGLFETSLAEIWPDLVL